jgi:hypothetical protein
MNLFSVKKRTVDRTLALRFTAVDQYNDSGWTTRSVFVPAVKPVVAFLHFGVDSLTYDPVTTYMPNPFTQTFAVVNSGDVSFKIDSVVMKYTSDGVSTAQSSVRAFNHDMFPGDSSFATWDFTAVRRDTARTFFVEARWFYGGKYQGTSAASVFLPALYEGLDAKISGDDSLQYDFAGYSPNPFAKILHIRNDGTVNLAIDSVVVSYNDAKLLFVGSSDLHQVVNQSLKPGDGLAFGWFFQSQKRDTTETTVFNIIIYHAAGTLPMTTSIKIPGRKTSYKHYSVSIPPQLALDPTGK